MKDPQNANGSTVRRVPTPQSESLPLVTPIFPSVVYTTSGPDELDRHYEGVEKGYTYAREGHPNADVLAWQINRLEGAKHGHVTGSGMGALSAVFLALLSAGGHVVSGNLLYGRSEKLLSSELPKFGVDVSLVNPCNTEEVQAAIRAGTKLVHLETISNPTLRIPDIANISSLAREAGILLVVDNTFATPGSFRPLEAGADIVVESVTKMLGGHSDVTLGYVGSMAEELIDRVRETATTHGFAPSPFDCWLAERGINTFELRFEKASQNAASLAALLAKQSGIRRVVYPGHPGHPDFAAAETLFKRGFGNLLSFAFEGGREAVSRFVARAPSIPFAPTLGDICTTISHPPTSSHRALTEEEREKLGITSGFIRVSVGIEKFSYIEEQFLLGLQNDVA